MTTQSRNQMARQSPSVVWGHKRSHCPRWEEKKTQSSRDSRENCQRGRPLGWKAMEGLSTQARLQVFAALGAHPTHVLQASDGESFLTVLAAKGGQRRVAHLLSTAFLSWSYLVKLEGGGAEKEKKKKKCTWALMRLKNSWRLGGHTTLVTRWGLFPRLLETKNIREEITWKLALSGEMWMLQILNNIKYEVRGRETGRKFKKQLATIPFLCCSLSWCSGCEEKVTSTPSS